MKVKFSSLLALLLLFGCAPHKEPQQNDIIDYVDPFIGTGFHGHTFPGATTPFGMVQLSPDTHLMGWDASSGYHYSDSTVYGFSHTHLSGTGIGDMGEILLLPYSGKSHEKLLGSFNKDNETASPGYYRVHLDNYNVTAELSATPRVGMHKYNYTDSSERKVMLDLSHALQPNWGHSITENHIRKINDHTWEGRQLSQGWAQDHLIAYRLEFSEDVEVVDSYLNGEKSALTKLKGTDIRLHFKFKDNKQPLLVKVALSVVDEKGASQNMQSELPGWDFDQTRSAAEQSWRDALGGIAVHTEDPNVLTNFYTALYHCMMSPYVYQDEDGRYRGMGKDIQIAQEGFSNYSVFSLWDTFRTFHPLMTLIAPEKAGAWAETLVQKYREGGMLPKWELASNYTGTMVGYPATSVMADALVKGLVPEANLEDWKNAAVHAASWQPEWLEANKGKRVEGVMSKHIYFKEKMEYVPSDSISASVSYGVEMAYYDWCVAQIAKRAGDDKTAEEFHKRANYYKHYFDDNSGFMRGKNADGKWREPFHPKHSDHDHADYTEGNAYQWSYFVPHDIEGHINLLGGAHVLEQSLDSLFTTSSEILGDHASADITGLIGQYAHGNEPSHHMAYLYNWTDSPWKTQYYLDRILHEFYLPEPAGIIGNEDCGQMSAWYVMNALGFYQVCPGDPSYSIGRPIVDHASIKVAGGTLEIVAHNNSRAHKYVDKVLWNGEELKALSIAHDKLANGGKLEFYMSGEAQ